MIRQTKPKTSNHSQWAFCVTCVVAAAGHVSLVDLEGLKGRVQLQDELVQGIQGDVQLRDVTVPFGFRGTWTSPQSLMGGVQADTLTHP